MIEAALNEGRIPAQRRAPLAPVSIPSRPNLRDALPALLAYVAVRTVGLIVVAVYGAQHHLSMIARLGTFWDAGWYVRIVQYGYALGDGAVGAHGIPYSPRAFFPLFPWLADPVHRVLGLSPGSALVVVASIASLAAAWGAYAVAALVHGRRVGVLAAALWGVLPLAVLENAAYSEALFTAGAAWTLYAVLTRRWLWAGSLCLLTGLTRPSAMAVTAAVAVAAVVEIHRIRTGRGRGVYWWRPLVGAVLSPLGWGGYMLYTGWAQGSWGGYFRIQRAWNSTFDGGVSTVHWFNRLLTDSGSMPRQDTVMALTVVAYLLFFALAVVGRQPAVLLVFSAALLVIDLGNASPYPPLARFLLPAFPLLFPPAALLARLRSRLAPVIILAAAAIASGGYGIYVTYLNGAP